MKLINSIKYTAAVAALSLSLTSCGDFLDRPAEDNYNAGNFYQNDEQCYQGVNYLYNSPWYDFQRGFIKVGEVLSGNIFMGSSPYLTFTVQGTDTDLINMSYSLWAVIGHASTVYGYINGASGPSEAVKNATMGEALTWKAMAYFYLVRTFGEVPIIHNGGDMIADGSYNSVFKAKRENVYEYIIMTLEKAIELLPERASQAGRIDKYCAEGLLAKVYLTRSGLGQSGTRNQEDLNMAAKFAKDVIDNSGRELMPVYSDIFRLQNNTCPESLIAWRWSAGRDPWTQQNTLQSDLGIVGFDEFGDVWGGWCGPSVDLQDAFGVNPINQNPSTRIDTDTRRKATMMMGGDKYEYFWQDKGGFDLLRFIYDSEYGKGGPGEWQCATGAYNVKHLYGNNYDHELATGQSAGNMYSALATHILRLADVYLIYAEAVLGNSASTSDANALAAYNAVRGRAIPGTTPKTSITFDDVWKERRLELACEGDRWYDYVRLSYYDPQRAINEIKSQRRNTYYGLNEIYKYYYENNQWDPSKALEADGGTYGYDESTAAPNVTASSFTLPFPTEDVVMNPNLLEPAVDINVRELYAY